MRKSGILFILLLKTLCMPAQNSDRDTAAAFRNAERLYSAALYDLAWTEYKRSLFFKEADPVFTNERMAYCRYQKGDLSSAFEHFRTAELLSQDKSDSLKNSYRFQQAEIQILRGVKSNSQKLSRSYYEEALFIVDATDAKGFMARKRLIYLGFINLLLDDFSKSGYWFNKYAEQYEPCIKEPLNKLLKSHSKKIRRANPKLAEFMSLILPGSGQIIANKPLAGLNSLMLNGSIIFLLYRVSELYSPQIAILALGSVTIRYYLGGSKTAKKHSNNLRQKRKEQALKELSALIEAHCK